MTSASTAEGISRTKDGVPGWDGDAATFQEYVEAAELYEQSVAYHKRSLVGPRLIAELQGSAKRLVVGQPADWVSYVGGVDRLLQYLREGLGQPRIPELTDHLLKFFKHSRRRTGESINSYVARKMEIYLRAQQAMKRLGPLHQKATTTETRPQDWYTTAQGGGTTATTIAHGGTTAGMTDRGEEEKPRAPDRLGKMSRRMTVQRRPLVAETVVLARAPGAAQDGREAHHGATRTGILGDVDGAMVPPRHHRPHCRN